MCASGVLFITLDMGTIAAPHRCKPDTAASCTCLFKDRVAVHRDKISGDGAVLVHLLKSRQGFLGFLGIFSTPYNIAVSIIMKVMASAPG